MPDSFSTDLVKPGLPMSIYYYKRCLDEANLAALFEVAEAYRSGKLGKLEFIRDDGIAGKIEAFTEHQIVRPGGLLETYRKQYWKLNAFIVATAPKPGTASCEGWVRRAEQIGKLLDSGIWWAIQGLDGCSYPGKRGDLPEDLYMSCHV